MELRPSLRKIETSLEKLLSLVSMFHRTGRQSVGEREREIHSETYMEGERWIEIEKIFVTTLHI